MVHLFKILIVCFIALGLGACGPLEAPHDDGLTPEGPSDPQTVRVQFEALVLQAKKGETRGIMHGMERYLLTREEMVKVFGEVKTAAAWPGYSDRIAAQLRAEAPDLLIKLVAQGKTEVLIAQVGPAYPKYTTPGDTVMLDAMSPKRAMYTIWIHPPNDPLGLRLNGFIYLDGRWKALLKSYDFLKPLP